MTRKKFLRATVVATAAVAGGLSGCATAGGHRQRHRFGVATFSADVTPPLGHALMGGGIAPAKEVVDPVSARGFVLLGGDKPLVLVSVEWCEIRNDAYERWRSVLAGAAGTEQCRVLVAATHVHDTPVADLTAQRLLNEARARGSICDPGFHEQAVQRVAAALRASLPSARRVTDFGAGQAQVEQVASNRRYTLPDGRIAFDRTSSTKNPLAHAGEPGLIDPWLKTLSFWDGDQPVLALHTYAVHPMSYYGQGGVSDDFVGHARRLRQADDPGVFQIYTSGCSGNLTAGKYNDGAPENRARLAGRLHTAMLAAWKNTQKRPLARLDFRCVPLRFEPRSSSGFTEADLRERLANDANPFGQCLAAMGLSWCQRVAAGLPIDVPAVDFGGAHLVLLPGEAYVEYQLLAQQTRPDSFVVALGYGESATGYIPTERHLAEHDPNLGDWCWVAPGCEQTLREAIAAALVK